VSKTEAPDYYDSVCTAFVCVVCGADMHTVIQHPMDLGTMLRRVKGKHYRSKREFKDDLDLIWANCLAYNHAPVRPRPHIPPYPSADKRAGPPAPRKGTAPAVQG
jgi:hypothetical protein